MKMLCNDVLVHIPSQLFSDVTLERDIGHGGTIYSRNWQMLQIRDYYFIDLLNLRK